MGGYGYRRIRVQEHHMVMAGKCVNNHYHTFTFIVPSSIRPEEGVVVVTQHQVAI